MQGKIANLCRKKKKRWNIVALQGKITNLCRKKRRQTELQLRPLARVWRVITTPPSGSSDVHGTRARRACALVNWTPSCHGRQRKGTVELAVAKRTPSEDVLPLYVAIHLIKSVVSLLTVSAIFVLQRHLQYIWCRNRVVVPHLASIHCVFSTKTWTLRKRTLWALPVGSTKIHQDMERGLSKRAALRSLVSRGLIECQDGMQTVLWKNEAEVLHARLSKPAENVEVVNNESETRVPYEYFEKECVHVLGYIDRICSCLIRLQQWIQLNLTPSAATQIVNNEVVITDQTQWSQME